MLVALAAYTPFGLAEFASACSGPLSTADENAELVTDGWPAGAK